MAGATHWGLLGALDALRTPLPWPGRLLVVGPVGLGDAVVAWPTVRALQEASPKTQITWLGQPAQRSIVAMMGITSFQPTDAPAGVDTASFDAIVSFADVDGAGLASRAAMRIGLAAARARPRWQNHLVHGSRLGWPRHEAQRHLRLLLPFGRPATESLAELAMRITLCAPAVALPGDLPERGAIVLHAFSAGHAREWPLAHWQALAATMASPRTPVVFTGSAAEGERLEAAWPRARRGPDVHDSFGRLDMPQLASLLQGAAAVVACSTGPLHLAAALGAPTLGLFAPRKGLGTDRWAALGAAATNVQAHRRCPSGRRCTREACACIAELTPQRIAQALPVQGRAADAAALAPFVVASAAPDGGTTIAASR